MTIRAYQQIIPFPPAPPPTLIDHAGRFAFMGRSVAVAPSAGQPLMRWTAPRVAEIPQEVISQPRSDLFPFRQTAVRVNGMVIQPHQKILPIQKVEVWPGIDHAARFAMYGRQQVAAPPPTSQPWFVFNRPKLPQVDFEQAVTPIEHAKIFFLFTIPATNGDLLSGWPGFSIINFEDEIIPPRHPLDMFRRYAPTNVAPQPFWIGQVAPKLADPIEVIRQPLHSLQPFRQPAPVVIPSQPWFALWTVSARIETREEIGARPQHNLNLFRQPPAPPPPVGQPWFVLRPRVGPQALELEQQSAQISHSAFFSFRQTPPFVRYVRLKIIEVGSLNIIEARDR